MNRKQHKNHKDSGQPRQQIISGNKKWYSILTFKSGYAYMLLSGFVLLLVLSHIYNQRFAADFWQHSAVVRELSLHPWSPEHPNYPVDAVHEFYGPYALMLGLFSRISGLDSITTLSLMGVVNLCLLLYCLRLFCLKLTSSELTAFFTLLFTLVLWGYNPWMFSQFYHLAAIGDTALFPCCFAAALTFFVWAKYIDVVNRGNITSSIYLCILLAVVLLSHPPTGIIMYVGLLSLFLGLRTHWIDKHTVFFVMIIFGSILLSVLWPYYKLTDLLFLGRDSQHHDGNRWMYIHIFRNTFAAFSGVPFLFARLKQKRRDPIFIMALLLIVLYIFGYISHKYVLGRLIPAIVFCLHFSLADWYGGVIKKVTSRQSLKLLEKATLFFITALIVIFVIGFFSVGIYRYRPTRESTYSSYLFLKDYATRQDVILSDPRTSHLVPSFAGKVVATWYPQTFVEDDDERHKDVNRFFEQATDNSDRISIINKYKVDFVLLDRRISSIKSIEDDIKNIGRVAYSSETFLLIDVKEKQLLQ